MYNLKWNIWLQYELFLSVVKPLLKQTRTVLNLHHRTPTFVPNCARAKCSFRITTNNLEIKLFKEITDFSEIASEISGLLESQLGSPLMIFKCYSTLRSNKVKTTPFVSVSGLSCCVFLNLYWHPQRDLSWSQWGPWFGSGCEAQAPHLAYRTFHLVGSTKRKKATSLFCPSFCLQT